MVLYRHDDPGLGNARALTEVFGRGGIGAPSYIEAMLEVEGMRFLQEELRRRITFGMEIHKKINKEKVKIKV